MPSLKLGTSSIKRLRLGTTVIKSAYLGSTLVFKDAFEYTYSGDTKSRNLKTDLENAGWNGSDDVEVTINTNVDIGANNTSGYALDCHSMPDTVILTIINNGYIRGAGGSGGQGAHYDNTPSFTNGSAGGPALRLGCPTIIVNASGYIWGGCVGGGGGNRHEVLIPGNGDKIPDTYVRYSGGGGGGGAGYQQGAGGPSIGADYNGNAGSLSAGGSGNNGEYSSSTTKGGNGGGPGSAGASAGGAGGAAGKAIHRNGFSCTFLSGNTSSRVKGSVSG